MLPLKFIKEYLLIEAILILLFIIGIYYSTRYAWWRREVDELFPRILMYHMISSHKDGAKFNKLRVTPENFEEQIKYLSEQGWHSFTVTELIEQGDNLPKKSIAITLDDGYEDNFTTALPILKKYNFKATLYLVVDRFNNDWSIHRKRSNLTGELKREVKISNRQVKEMLQSKLIEIGAHSMTHKNFHKLTLDKTKEEIEKSKIEIEKKFDTECKSFAYPFGFYKDNDWKLVQKLGFSSAVTTDKGISNFKEANKFLLNRITISGTDNFLAFSLKLKTGKRGLNK